MQDTLLPLDTGTSLHCCLPWHSTPDPRVGNTDIIVPANLSRCHGHQNEVFTVLVPLSLVSDSKSQISASDWQSLNQGLVS